MPQTLRRSRSRPLADISNLKTAPTLPSAPIACKTGLAQPSSSPLVDLPHTDSPPFTPNSGTDDCFDSSFDSDDDNDDLEPPRAFRTSFESRQWKECTPILDDPVGEALAEQSFIASPLSADASRPIEPFTAQCTSSSDDEACGDELDGLSARSVSTVDEHDGASKRSSEDGASTITTPDTSVPASSSPWTERCDPHDESSEFERPERVDASTSTSTPPRPSGRFVELVETCPTPPPRATTSARSRSLLVASGLGVSDAPDGGHDINGDALLAASSSRRSSRTASRSRERTRSSSAHSTRAPSPDLAEPTFPRPESSPASSYTPSLYPDAAHYDTYTRRPRLRRSVTHMFAPEEQVGDVDNGDEQLRDALAFPPAEALVADLLRAQPGEAAARRGAWDGDEALEPLRHVRPVTTPGLDDACALRRSSASPAPFSSLVSPGPLHNRPDAARSSRLPAPRHQPSSSTLLTYDLSHLPAPNSPRERPYRVSWTDVVRPSAFVRAGRGSGRCGDVWGAVERRVEEPRSGARGRAGAVGACEGGARRRSWFGKASAPSSRPDEAHGPSRRSTPSRLDELAVLAPPAAPRAGIVRSGSMASVRRSLSRLGRRMSLGPRASGDELEQDGHEGRERDVKAYRRRSLVASIFGGSWADERPSVEELDQWVAVVVR
ncbi:hypothetical protein JCM3775_006066 [Rhodotorula graminis]|uniref:Uncharacterized protein n=1 Tax=Rhodotorula graminis (strain WP1) TaxID=578459 RepID=A0A194S9W6_RHOGW|nr:uncharacterized protein RHOBADRAFT_51259 [Rhodotorula graminis WP1]KPV77402.1 hypothetical protein RHOBADRAFT_51259 [Rhodotorula graminis WP1]